MTTVKEVRSYIDSHLDDWTRHIILDEVIRYAQAANLPKSFVKRIKLEKTGPGQYQLVNDWTKTSKYGKALLAIYFEYGTKQHYIKPRFAKSLTWLHPGHKNREQLGEKHGHAIYYQRADTKPGDQLFSKGHYVSGLPKTLAMHRGFAAGKARLQQYIQQQVRAKFGGAVK